MLLTYGVTLVITGSRIAAPLRRLVTRIIPKSCYFVQCPLCVGWWVGLGLALLTPRLGPLSGLGWPIWVQGLGEAFCASALCWGIHVLLAKLGAEEL